MLEFQMTKLRNSTQELPLEASALVSFKCRGERRSCGLQLGMLECRSFISKQNLILAWCPMGADVPSAAFQGCSSFFTMLGDFYKSE